MNTDHPGGWVGPPWGEGVTLDIPGGWVGGWVGDEVILSLKSDRSNILLNNFKYTPHG